MGLVRKAHLYVASQHTRSGPPARQKPPFRSPSGKQKESGKRASATGGLILAQFRCSVKPRLSRGKGASVARAMSYVMREKIEDDRTGETFDFSGHKDKALFTGIYAPKDAPEWVHDFQKLANEIEKAERRKDAQLALPVELSLSHELTLEQNKWMLQDFIKENFTRKDYVAIAAIHEPPRGGDERNIHAHLLVSLRKIDENGFAKTKKEQQENFLSRSERVEVLRESWEKHLKHHLKRHGFEKEAEEVSCKTLAEQGIDREPTQHLGPTASHIERQGEASERGDINREIEARNKERERLQIEARAVGRELTEQAPEGPREVMGQIIEERRRGVGYDVLREAEQTETKRREILQKREESNASNRDIIREAAQKAEGGIDFMMQLQEGGLQLATDKWGRFVAVAPSGFHYEVGKMARPELLQDIEAQRAGGLVIQTADQVREEQRQAREAKRLEWEKREKENELRTVKRGNVLFSHGGMASQQKDALRHHKDHTKAQEKHERETKREEKGEGFAGRKDHGQQKREDRTARTEQTENMKRHALKEAMRERFERTFGKGHNEQDREGFERERERER